EPWDSRPTPGRRLRDERKSPVSGAWAPGAARASEAAGQSGQPGQPTRPPPGVWGGIRPLGRTLPAPTDGTRPKLRKRFEKLSDRKPRQRGGRTLRKAQRPEAEATGWSDASTSSATGSPETLTPGSEPVRLADLPHRHAARLGGQPVEEQRPVEVVRLVL